jgi:hypothetical protein
MKEVHANWLAPKESYNSLGQLLSNNFYVGMISHTTNKKYMVITSGSARGMAVRPSGTFCDPETLKTSQHVSFYIFDSEKELYDWLVS